MPSASRATDWILRPIRTLYWATASFPMIPTSAAAIETARCPTGLEGHRAPERGNGELHGRRRRQAESGDLDRPDAVGRTPCGTVHDPVVVSVSVVAPMVARRFASGVASRHFGRIPPPLGGPGCVGLVERVRLAPPRPRRTVSTRAGWPVEGGRMSLHGGSVSPPPKKKRGGPGGFKSAGGGRSTSGFTPPSSGASFRPPPSSGSSWTPPSSGGSYRPPAASGSTYTPRSSSSTYAPSAPTGSTSPFGGFKFPG